METRGTSVRDDSQPSGSKVGLSVEEEEELARGRTRSGTLFTRQSRGHYSSLATLKKVHHKIFSLNSTFCLVGE
jgi:hypothetical protein